jgi:phosphate starvation-inducible PhoH-like protein
MSEPQRDTVTFEVPEGRLALAPLWGPQDAHRRLLERRLDVKLAARGDQITVSGRPDRVAFARRVIEELLALVRGGSPLFLQDIEQMVNLLDVDRDVKLEGLRARTLAVTHDRRSVAPKTPNQQRYVEALTKNDLVFAIGPAGTGKTYLAMAAATAALNRHEVRRIILARPAVEAGERLGFLPGTLVDKVNPYLRPLYDALYDLLGVEQVNRLIESGVIEVAPLAFMRGRTLNNAFVILDEAQNATVEQMKMFLTRLGHSSRAVVTGDVTQVDLEPRRGNSGLAHAVRILEGIEGIGTVTLTATDVVRHSLVQAIVRAYDRDSDASEAP